MSHEWKVNDPVVIDSRNSSKSSTPSQPLTGIVAFVGPVSFAEGNDWVGVRLTGDSVNKGKNDGTVKGVKYFDNCGPNNGMFVRASALKRQEKQQRLSRLEELRLKRELKTKKSVSSPSVRRLNLSNSADDESSVSSFSTQTTSATNRSRLDEIRSRRLALQKSNSAKLTVSPTSTPEPSGIKIPHSGGDKKRNNISTPSSVVKNNLVDTSTPVTSTPLAPSSTPHTPGIPITTQYDVPMSPSTTSPSKAEIENAHLKTKIEILSDKLHSTDDLKTTLQEKLNNSAKENHELKLKVNELNASIDQIKQESEKKILSAVAASNNNDYIMEINQMKDEIKILQLRNSELQKESKEQMNQMQINFQSQLFSVQQSLEQQLNQKEADNAELKSQMRTYEGKILSLEKELNEKEEKTALRNDHDSTHYKERAKLQAEILSWSRKVQEVTKEKLEMEIALEELTLDKDSLQQRCEEMEDTIDELKIDAESAQIEADELKIELESARGRAEKAESAIALMKAGGSTGSGEKGEASGGGSDTDAEDIAQALSIQNTRLREAIIRLREQTTFEKMELTKQLRVAEKESLAVDGLKDEIAKLLASEKNLKLEVNELKEMVDQGNAFEQMVEEMSDRVLAVEDNNIALQSDIRELEEAAELSAEMEEAQAEEIKELMKELQGRDTIVANLEEAIKVQRKRELDFQRTIGNYRKSIEILAQEKNALLVLHQGGEGEKKDALVTSQKALATAKKSVADAELARKREANATFNLIDAKVKSHLAERLEQFLPQSIVSSEVAAVKGELLLSKIAMKSSLSLNSLFDIFEKIITTANTALGNMEETRDSDIQKIEVTSNLLQQVGIISHQTKFAQLAIDVSSECLRLLSFSQWPDILSADASVDFSISVSQSIPQLDSTISDQLLRLKEEGFLSPHQSNLVPLIHALKTVRASLDDILDEEYKPILPKEWMPPTLKVLSKISKSKYACLGSASLLASIVNDEEIRSPDDRYAFVSEVFRKVYDVCKELQTVDNYLGLLLTGSENLVNKLLLLVSDLSTASYDLFSFIDELFTKDELFVSDMFEVQSKSIIVSNITGRLLASLRSHGKEDNTESKLEELLSPEVSDPWEAVNSLTSKLCSQRDDVDESNYIMRGRKLEKKLSTAIENDAKLTIANSKIRSLEKNLATRSKEISMQNSRLIELEGMLSKTTNRTAITPDTDAPISDSNELKEEIRVLNEALEVLQTQVDEYEREIRLLKNPQKGKNRRTPGSAKKGVTTDNNNFSISNLGSTNSSKLLSQDISSGLVETAFYRPALLSARADAADWKSKSMAETLFKLPALSATVGAELSDMESERHRLLMANAELRRQKARISIVDICEGSNKSSLLRFNEEQQNTVIAMERLQELSNSIRFKLFSKVM